MKPRGTKTRFLVAAVLLIAGNIGGWYGFQNYLGWRDWTDTRHDLEALGESLDAASFIPPPIPDAENLALAPYFQRLYQYRIDPQTGTLTFKTPNTEASAEVSMLPFGAAGVGPKRPDLPTWTSAHPLDLPLLREYYRQRPDFPHVSGQEVAPAVEVLRALNRFDDTFNEVARAAAERPRTRFPINWNERPVWQLALPEGLFVQSFNSALRLRACAFLAVGQPDAALKDILLGLRFCRALEDEPILLSVLVNAASVNLVLQPVWEGLAIRGWNDAQLQELQGQLQAFDLLRACQRASRCERTTFTLSMREELRKPGGVAKVLAVSQLVPPDGPPKPGLQLLGRLAPGGWADKAVAYACRWEQRYFIDAIDAAERRVSPARLKENTEERARLRMLPSTFLVKSGWDLMPTLTRNVARAQAGLDQAAVACALERYYLTRQSYPAHLDELVPAYLDRVPTDMIDGQPLHYEPTPDSRYRLWNVGWDERDDHATIVWRSSGRPDDGEGDWVWQYTAVSPPVKP